MDVGSGVGTEQSAVHTHSVSVPQCISATRLNSQTMTVVTQVPVGISDFLKRLAVHQPRHLLRNNMKGTQWVILESWEEQTQILTGPSGNTALYLSNISTREARPSAPYVSRTMVACSTLATGTYLHGTSV